MKKVIQVDANIVENMKRLDLEISSRRELIAYMLSNGMNTDSQQFKEYEKEYKQFFLEYSDEKNKIERNYVISNLKKGEKVNWVLDYATGELTYEC